MTSRWILVALSCAASVARADDTFEMRAQAAKRARLDEVAWVLTAGCTTGDDVEQRQCRLVRDRAWTALAGQAVLVEGDRRAFVVGAWDPQKKSLPMTLDGCLHCDDRLRIVAAGAAKLHDSARAVPDEASAQELVKLVGNARVELVVKLPARRPKPAKQLALEVAAWRVIAPCDGSAVIANPPSSGVPPDKQACSKKP